MNVFIVAACVNLLTIVNVMCAVHNINLNTILKILKDKPRKSSNSINGRTNDPDNVIPILPGFYLEKPKELSASLFKNPKPTSDDIFDILTNEEEARSNKRILSSKTENKNHEEDDLQEKIVKAVNDLKKYRAKQRKKNDNLKQSNAVVSNTAQKGPVKKLLGRVFQGIKRGIDYTGNANKKKPKNKAASPGNQVLNQILRKILSGNLNNKKYRASDKRAHRNEKQEAEKQKREDLLGDFLNAIENDNQGIGNKKQQHPSVVLLSPKSFKNYVTEEENTAKESIEESDIESSEPLLYNTRRKDDPDIGSKTISDSSETGSSDYERNPGNPFTIHKNKYKQNWPYNHFMDGDHMNINPFGPQFGNLGPTGPELFFGRKWWYFNQDDYKPMG